jgi:hypothetical protein
MAMRGERVGPRVESDARNGDRTRSGAPDELTNFGERSGAVIEYAQICLISVANQPRERVMREMGTPEAGSAGMGRG